MLTIILKFATVLYIVGLLHSKSSASKIVIFNVVEKDNTDFAQNYSSIETVVDEKKHLNTRKGIDVFIDAPSVVENKENNTLYYYVTEEAFVTESMTTEFNEKINENKSATANPVKEESDRGRVKRSKQVIGQVSDEEREYIKYNLRNLMRLVDYLKGRELNPVLDSPLDQLVTALDKLMGDADELPTRSD